MYVVQNSSRPGEILNALHDIMRPGLSGARVCSAYVTLSGSEILLDAIRRAAREDIAKTIVCSLDYGLTDPDALEFWQDTANTTVLVAGTERLAAGSLQPIIAFHPKLYVFDRDDAASGCLVGSANLTNRGLSTNCEAGWAELASPAQNQLEIAWDLAIDDAAPLTAQILARYRRLRARTIADNPPPELERVPQPAIGPPRSYTPFGDADIDPADYNQMWVQSRGMQGGAGTQLELPRGSHRFFGADYEDYDFARVDHIAEPVLVSGRHRWRNRPLTWHGDNAMERINMPSRTMGGFAYEHSLILFRRIAANTFEFRVFPWDSDHARAYVEASRQQDLVFRVGRNSNRLAGFIP